MARSLTERQRRFVEAYLVSRNATQAARVAGYSHEARPRDRLRAAASRACRRRPAGGLDPPRGLHPATQLRKPLVRRRRSAMNPLEERFALAYLLTGNAAEAARRAGLKVARANIGGCKMLQRPHVAAFIEAERAASIARTRIDVDRVKREFARIAFMDIADVIEWDEEGIALKPSAQISPDDRAAIAQLKVKTGEHGVKASIKLHSKQAALDSLAKLMGLYGKKSFVTIDHEQERRDLRERLMRIMRGDEEDAGETKEEGPSAAEPKEPEKSGA
jgi:phage terminase small subunit